MARRGSAILAGQCIVKDGRITLAFGMHLMGKGDRDSEEGARRSASICILMRRRFQDAARRKIRQVR